MTTAQDTAIEINLNSAVGPVVLYPLTASEDDIEAELPEGWEVDYDTVAADCYDGRKSSPLRRSVTDAQIKALRAEAAAAGDEDQVDLCDFALRGDYESREECVAAIRDAEAMAAGDEG